MKPLQPLGDDFGTNPRTFDERYYPPEEVELFNPNGPVNPPAQKKKKKKKKKLQQKPQKQLGWVSCWAIFSIPGLFCIIQEGAGFVAAVGGAVITIFVGTLWANVCPFRSFVVKNGILLCGSFTLITAGIGLFIPPRYLFVIAIAVAAYAAYMVTRDEKT